VVTPVHVSKYDRRAAAVAGGLKYGLHIWMAWKAAIGAVHSGVGVPTPVTLAMQRKTEQGSPTWARAGVLKPRPKAAASAKVAETVRSFMMNLPGSG
jgi:hypothetical protein